MNRGVIVGADISQEWLLPWWWAHYKKHNSHPVVFVDLGMSFKMKDWCKERGVHIPLRMCDFAAGQEEIDPALTAQWEYRYGPDFWEQRNAWFKKPLAFLKSPFEKTVWIDLDCEIRGPIDPVFKTPPGLAMVKDRDEAYPVYNSGVVVFDRGTFPLIQEWAERCVRDHALFFGDQEVLSCMMMEKGLKVVDLNPRYNWSRRKEDREDTVIHHWHGGRGKVLIRQLMMLQSLS